MNTVQALKQSPPLDFVREPSPYIESGGGGAWKRIGDELMVTMSESLESDGRTWIHVAFSRPTRLPSWSDMKRVKDAFIGKERRAISVLPRASEYVNIHPYCLHLFACLDDDGLPDFRRGGAL